MDKRSARSRCRSAAGDHAFTLVETILVLAVITLLGTLLLPGVNSVLRSINHEDPHRLFWDVVTTVREEALTRNRTVLLRIDSDKNTLTWDFGTERRQTLPAGASIRFLQPKLGSMVLLGGTLLETDELSVIRFYPDGTCDRFRAQITVGKSVQVIPVDPWTCAPVFGDDR